MSVWYEIFVKDFKWLKLCFFLLTSFLLLGEFQLFFIDKPSLRSEGIEDLTTTNEYPEYCNGMAYLMTSDLIPEFLKASNEVRIIMYLSPK